MHMTTHSPTRLLHPTPLRVATVTLCLMLGGCSIIGDWFPSANTDYKGASKRTQPLDVPPDLTQLQKDSRYLPQGGMITASDLSKPGGAASAPATAQPVAAPVPPNPEVALAAAGNMHLEHEGDRHWLQTLEAPEVVLPKVRAYWLSQGYTLTVDEPKTGILETDWKQNRAKLPSDGIRNILSGVLDNLSDSGFRDRFRTRLERRADGGTDVYVTHFGAAQQVTGKDNSVQSSDVVWMPRPSDPGLEAEQLSEMMLSLAGVTNTEAAPKQHSFFHFGDDDDDAASAPANGGRVIPSASTSSGTTGGTGPNGAMRAHAVTGLPGATMEVEDNFDRSWRRIGLALDHGGFTVEDRDRAQGIYYVRYVDAKEAAKDEPGFFSKFTSWFTGSGPSPVGKYRISIKAPADVATVTVLNDQGQPDNSDNARQIVRLLVDELK